MRKCFYGYSQNTTGPSYCPKSTLCNVPNSKLNVNLCFLLVADQVKPGCLCLGQLLLQQNHRLVQSRHLVQLPSKGGIFGWRAQVKNTGDVWSYDISYVVDILILLKFPFTSRLWGGSLQDSTSGRWLLFFSLVWATCHHPALKLRKKERKIRPLPLLLETVFKR